MNNNVLLVKIGLGRLCMPSIIMKPVSKMGEFQAPDFFQPTNGALGHQWPSFHDLMDPSHPECVGVDQGLQPFHQTWRAGSHGPSKIRDFPYTSIKFGDFPAMFDET